MQEKSVRPNSKAKISRADSKSSKGTSPLIEAAHLGPKRKLPLEPLAQVCHHDVFHFHTFEHVKQSDSDAETSNTTPRVSSSLRRITDNLVRDHLLTTVRSVNHLSLQKSDSELSSLVDEPSKKKARGKSKVNSFLPLFRALISPSNLTYAKIQNSEVGKPRVKSKRPKQISQTLSKDDETIKRLKVPIFDFVGSAHAPYSLNFSSLSSSHAA